MGFISIPLALYAVWRASRHSPPGTVFGIGIVFAIVGSILTYMKIDIVGGLEFNLMIVGLICIPIGLVELAQLYFAARRRRAEAARDFDLGALQQRIAELAQNAKPGEKLTVEVVREEKPHRKRN